MYQRMKKGLAAMLSVVFVASLLLNRFSIGVFALNEQDTMASQIAAQLEQEGVFSGPETETPEIQPAETPAASAVPTQQPEATETPVPTSVPEATEIPTMTATPVPTATAAPEQAVQQPDAVTVEELKEQIRALLLESLSLTEMTEQELKQALSEIDALTAQPAALAENGQQDEELQELMDQLANARVAMDDMRMAWQAKREGWLGQLPQTGKENSWRYQNGELIDQDLIAENMDVPDGVNFFAAGGYWGIDVSHHQGTINWEKVKAAGVDFAIIRCGYGMNLTEQDDKQWSRNVSECERLGIPYGVYFYSYAMTADMAVEEGAHAVRLLEGHTPDLPVFYDMEENDQLVLGQGELAEIARIFCDIVGSKGYEVGVYASLNWWQYYLTDAVFENWYRWVAEWRSSCSYNGRYEMWQYTSKGSVNGINGNVDMNYWYGDLESWLDQKAQITEGVYSISTALTTGKALDVSGGSYSDGAALQIYQDNGSRAQQFFIESVGSGYYTITNLRSGKCLTVAGNSTKSGAAIQQSAPNGSAAQQWYFVDAGNGSYMIRSRASGLYLDVVGGNSASGTKLQIYKGNLTNSQKFKLQKKNTTSAVSEKSYVVESALKKNQVLDITNGSYDSGAKLQLYTNSGSRAQQFVFEEAGLGYYTITNVRSGKVLEVAGNKSGAAVQQAAPNGSDSQKWYVESAGNGYYCIRSKSSSLYLDVTGGKSVSGTKLQIYAYNNTNSQKFKLMEADSATVTEGIFTLQSALNNNQVLDISGGSYDEGAKLQIYTDSGSRAQQFIVESAGNGCYTLTNVRSGKVLAVSNGSNKSGTGVVQMTPNGSDEQKWTIENVGGGYYAIRSKSSSLYLDVAGGSSKSGTRLQIYSYNGTASQKFKFKSVPSLNLEEGTYTLTTALKYTMALDITNGSAENGAQLQIYAANGSRAQQFEIQSCGNGYYKLINILSGKALTAPGGSGTVICQQSVNGLDNQEWFIESVSDGTYRLRSKATSLYMDVTGGKSNSGTKVQSYKSNQTASQKFKLTKIAGK